VLGDGVTLVKTKVRASFTYVPYEVFTGRCIDKNLGFYWTGNIKKRTAGTENSKNQEAPLPKKPLSTPVAALKT
jgi:hypothetical protein